MLHVEPPLHPEGGTLYVHTFPNLLEDIEYERPASVAHLPHQLEESSYLTFCRAVLDDYDRMLQEKYTNEERSSGGSEPVGDEWDMWNTQQQTEGAPQKNGYVFEYLESQSFDLSAVEPPSIYQDLLLYNQLTADYSWMGVTVAVNWTVKLRNFDRAHETRWSSLLFPDSSFSGNVPTFDGNIKEHALILWLMKIPFDGDPPISSPSPDDWDSDDGPYIKLDLVPKSMSPVSAPSTRVIAFDLFGTILDRDGAINDAMRLLSPTHPDRHLLSELYLECELMRHRDNSDAPYTSIVRQALEDVCVFLEVPLNEVVLYKAVQAVLQPSLYADAEAAVGTPLDQGYALLGLPIPDARSFLPLPLPFGLNVDNEPAPLSNSFSQNHSILQASWSAVAQHVVLPKKARFW